MSLAINHFVTLCCLGLPKEAALIAIAAGIRDLIPSSWTRIGLFDQHGSTTSAYAEHGAFPALVMAGRTDHFVRTEPTSIAALMLPAWRAAGIGWTLPKQNADYLQTGYYSEIERPLDSCWLLDAMVHDGTRSIVGLILSRPRGAKPFRSDDVVLLDRVRPWIAHAFRERATPREEHLSLLPARPLSKGTLLASAAGQVLFRSDACPQLFMMLNGTLSEIGKHLGSDKVETPTAVLRVIRELVRAASGHTASPPRLEVMTVWGLIVVEAVWLAEFGVTAADVVANQDAFQISVSLELREHALPYAARVLRSSGASPGQVRIGVLLATGMTKPAIAQELGIKSSSVMDATRKIYERLEVRNAAELGMRLWTSPTRKSG